MARPDVAPPGCGKARYPNVFLSWDSLRLTTSGERKQGALDSVRRVSAAAPIVPMRLLVVEDDLKLQRVLARGLSLEGYEVDVAGTGDAALAAATAEHYDVIVLDVMLPGIDGFEVCRTLRGRGRSMPVLMLTALTGVDDRIRGLDEGADDYLVKPFDFGELLARLRALTRRETGGRSDLLELG